MATNDDILNAVKNGEDFNMSNATCDQLYELLRRTPATPVKRIIYRQCYVCGNTFPRDDLVDRMIEVEVGRTSGSPNISGSMFSFGGKQGKAVRIGYSAGRTHYRNKNVLVCKGCIQQEQEQNKIASQNEDKAIRNFLIFFAILCLIIYIL